MENNNQYRNCLVIFIDMLGTQAKLDINDIYADYDTFHTMILSKDGTYITDGRDGGISSGRNIRIQAHTFSDCAYILYHYEDETIENEDDKGILIENALCHFERIILKLLDEAVVFRGGVSYGEVFYEKQKNILFGPAVNGAYQLEEKYAKTPRILVSHEIANIYNDYFKKCVERFENPTDDHGKRMKRVCECVGIGNPKIAQGRIIEKDDYDNNYIFNYLNSVKTVSNIFLPEIVTNSSGFIEALFSYVQEQSNRAELNNNQKVKSKYDWLMDYVSKLQNE